MDDAAHCLVAVATSPPRAVVVLLLLLQHARHDEAHHKEAIILLMRLRKQGHFLDNMIKIAFDFLNFMLMEFDFENGGDNVSHDVIEMIGTMSRSQFGMKDVIGNEGWKAVSSVHPNSI